MGVETILRASRLGATPAMTNDSQLSFSLPSVSRKKITAAFDGGRLSSDSGVMLLALADRRRNVADTLAAHIADRRDPSRIAHTVADVLRARMLAIGCGYPTPTVSVNRSLKGDRLSIKPTVVDVPDGRAATRQDANQRTQIPFACDAAVSVIRSPKAAPPSADVYRRCMA